MKLVSHLDANLLRVYNLDSSTADTSAAVTVGRLTTVEDNLSAAIDTLEASFNAAINNLDIKLAVRVAAKTNIDIATGGTMTIQGVVLAADDRVLLTSQTDASENGIYLVKVGSWVRSEDANTSVEVTSGMAIPVSEGDLADQGLWLLATADPIVLDTTNLSLIRQRNLRDLTISGGGLNLSGSYVLSLIGTTDRIVITGGGGIDIASNYAGQSSIVTVGTIATGTWQGSNIAVAYGGTGATSAGQARINLGTAEEYSVLVGNGASTTYTVTHSLNNSIVSKPSVIEVATGTFVEASYRVASADTVEVTFASAPANNSLRVVIIGVKKAA